jgi:holo-[acyl-carrier protein] synthase
MIIGIGTDIVDIARITASLNKSDGLAKRILTQSEYTEFESSNDKGRYLAKKFASKEATVKAIGTGIGNGMGWQQIEISHDPLGKPILNAKGAFKEWCEQQCVSNMHISIADEDAFATAFVVLER